MFYSSATILSGCVDSRVDYIRICSKMSLRELGPNMDQLITYDHDVSCNPSGLIVELLEVFDHCQEIVCGEGGKSVALSGKA